MNANVLLLLPDEALMHASAQILDHKNLLSAQDRGEADACRKNR